MNFPEAFDNNTTPDPDVSPETPRHSGLGETPSLIEHIAAKAAELERGPSDLVDPGEYDVLWYNMKNLGFGQPKNR